jgi:hypothetical protein
MAYEKAFFHKELGEFITPRVVLAWPSVLTARRVPGDEAGALRFTVTGLFSKSVDISVLLEEFNRAGKAEFGAISWGNKKSLHRAINTTADDEALQAFADEYPHFIKGVAKAEYKPLIYGPDIKPWSGEATEIYSGRRALLGGKFFSYKTGKGGVSFGLNRVILLENGEHLPIGGAARPISADGSGFEPVDIGEGESASDMFA